MCLEEWPLGGRVTSKRANLKYDVGYFIERMMRLCVQMCVLQKELKTNLN